MELYKRADGKSPFWFVNYADPSTGKRQRVSLKTTDKGEAMAKAVALLDAGGKHRLTLGDALNAYCASLSGRAYYTESVRLAAKATGSLAQRFRLDPAMDIARLDTAAVARLADARRAEGNSPQTVAHELKLLRAAVRYASARGAVVNRDMEWPMPKLVAKTRYLTVEEFNRVHALLAPDRLFSVDRGGVHMHWAFGPDTTVARQRQDAQDLFVALTLCGGRWSEVASLRWDRVDVDAGTIRLWGSKTQKERLVPMPAMMRTMLQRRYTDRRQGQELVFPGLDGKQRRHTCQAIKKAFTQAGLNTSSAAAELGRATIHSLRHTFASLLLQRGASLADIQHALGHKNLTMTMRYAHLLQSESVAKLTTILDNTIGG